MRDPLRAENRAGSVTRKAFSTARALGVRNGSTLFRLAVAEPVASGGTSLYGMVVAA